MNYPKPPWKPVRIEPPAWHVDRLAHYTDRRKGFAVYQHGTAVFDGNSKSPDIAQCNARLVDVVTHSPDFSVVEMRDGCFLVSFRGSVFAVVDGEFVGKNRQWLLTNAKAYGLFPSEKLLAPSAKAINAGHHAIGLFARANLYLDVEDQIVVARFSPLILDVVAED
jgi:hypothetical protein